ncbi:response regulator [Alteromonadaceae bacterium M269]|nr:response regulator [Alteromonadaceae bacterium M269]
MSFSVLICDDSALARKSVRRCLPEELQENVTFAANGQEAVDYLQDNPTDLLFLDLTMPVLDGVGVLEAIKREKIEVFVIVISGDVQPQMQSRVRELGALDFISKPIDSERLTKVLQTFGLY